jgi:hypothetical protein
MKTSVAIPDGLWKAAKILAVEESKDLRNVIVEALQLAIPMNLAT